jgi:hypothetical protein
MHRALKRISIQGHDTGRELQFFAGEMRSARFASDWPFPWPLFKASGWTGLLRFWMGMIYQLLSNFGRARGKCAAAYQIGFPPNWSCKAEARVEANPSTLKRQQAPVK